MEFSRPESLLVSIMARGTSVLILEVPVTILSSMQTITSKPLHYKNVSELNALHVRKVKILHCACQI